MRSIAFHSHAVLIAVAVAATAPVAAQDAGELIVVRGARLTPQEARERASDFVKRSGVANGQKQVARWAIPICIKAIGISDAQGDRLTNRMLAIAQAAGIPTARRNCDPNITVTFTTDPVPLIAKIASKKPHQFKEVPREDREKLLTGTAPVRWWYATQHMDRDNVGANNISAPWITNGNENEGGSALSLPTGDGVTATQQYNGGSIVRTPTIRSIYAANVVIDAGQIGDAKLDSIAHFSAMVAFAELEANDPPPDSILRLFQPNSIETGLTDWDLAFLRSLYRMPLDRRSRIQRGHLVTALLDERQGTGAKRKTP